MHFMQILLTQASVLQHTMKNRRRDGEANTYFMFYLAKAGKQQQQRRFQSSSHKTQPDLTQAAGARQPRPALWEQQEGRGRRRGNLTAPKPGFGERWGGAGPSQAGGRGAGAAPGAQTRFPQRPLLPPGPRHRPRPRRPGQREVSAAGFALQRLRPGRGSAARGERGPPSPPQPPRSPRHRPRSRSSRTKAPTASPGPLPGPAPLSPPRPGGLTGAGARHLPGRRGGDGRARPGSGGAALAWSRAERVGPEPTWCGRAGAGRAERGRSQGRARNERPPVLGRRRRRSELRPGEPAERRAGPEERRRERYQGPSSRSKNAARPRQPSEELFHRGGAAGGRPVATEGRQD